MNFILKKLERKQLIDWGVILHGWKGIPEYGRIVDSEDIVEFTIKEIEKKEEYISDTLIELFSAGLLEKEEVTELLEDICDEENVNTETSFEKLLLTVLEINLEYLLKEKDYIYGLDRLSNFWIAWGNPQGNPHTFLRNYSYIEQDEYDLYYSEENYNKILNDNQQWLKQKKQKMLARSK